MTVPLIRVDRESGTIFLNTNIEIFINMGDRRGFDQNRLYVAGGYQFNPLANLQLGYMWIAREDADLHRIWTFFTYNFDFR